MASGIVTPERVRELLSYNPETGEFYRKKRLAQRHQEGDRADFVVTGGRLAGYRRVSFDSMRFLAHRLAWFYVYGEWPKLMIDHINQDKGDNRICNLRLADDALNQQNICQAQKNNGQGIRGASNHGDGKHFRVRVGMHKRYYDFGLFQSAGKAGEAYTLAKRLLQDGCSYELAKTLVRAECP